MIQRTAQVRRMAGPATRVIDRAGRTVIPGLIDSHLHAIRAASFFANALFESNRDFALNAVNWLAEREYRIKVAPLPRGESFLDFQRSAAKPVLTYGLWFVLPGLSLAIGLLVFLRRRR